jgi:hypothetical protein
MLNFKMFVTCLFLVFSSTIQAQQMNFSGKWLLNEEQSNFGSLTLSAIPDTILINHQKDSLAIGRYGETNWSICYPVNGNKIGRSMPGNRRREASIKFLETEKSFIESSVTNFEENGSQLSTQTIYDWTLSRDGKILTCKIKFITSGGAIDATILYNKLY